MVASAHLWLSGVLELEPEGAGESGEMKVEQSAGTTLEKAFFPENHGSHTGMTETHGLERDLWLPGGSCPVGGVSEEPREDPTEGQR